MLNKKDLIMDLYYNQKLKQCEVAEKLNVSKQYVSRIVKEDERFLKRKEGQKQENAEKRKLYMKDYHKNYVRTKKKDDVYEQLQAQLKQDTLELSYYNNISDYDFAKWNSSAYHTNGKGNLVLNRNLSISSDLPKSINKNIKVKTQKYKRIYCYSR